MLIIDNDRSCKIVAFDSAEQRDRWLRRFAAAGRYTTLTAFLDVHGPAIMATRIPTIGPRRNRRPNVNL